MHGLLRGRPQPPHLPIPAGPCRPPLAPACAAASRKLEKTPEGDVVEKRFVSYSGDIDPTSLPAEWHQWLHKASGQAGRQATGQGTSGAGAAAAGLVLLPAVCCCLLWLPTAIAALNPSAFVCSRHPPLMPSVLPWLHVVPPWPPHRPFSAGAY